MVLTVAGWMMLITPPKLQMHLEMLSKAGIPPISTVVAPGTQGEAVAGTQAAPKSTAQEPKGKILTKGIWSMMLAAGGPSAITRLVGKTTRLEGAAPKLHCKSAPMETCCGIESASLMSEERPIRASLP